MSNESVDLSVLIHNARRLQTLSRPILQTVKVAEKIRRWEAPSVNFAILMIVNSTCFLLPGAYLLVLLLMLLGGALMLAITHQRTSCLHKVIPSGEGQTEFMSHQDLMHEYTKWLCLVNEISEEASDTIRYIYDVLICTHVKQAIRFYLCTTLLTFCFCLMTSQASVAMFVNILFLDYKTQHVISQLLLTISERRAAKQLEKERIGDVNIEEEVSVSNVQDNGTDWSRASSGTDLAGQVADTEIDQEILQDKLGQTDMPEDNVNRKTTAQMTDTNEESEKDNSSDSIVLPPVVDVQNNSSSSSTTSLDRSAASGSKPTGVVGKLLDLKRKHTSPPGNCTTCNATFTSILKRRHMCSSCGFPFCSKCCNTKVPRAILGATAPAAKTETVSVCHPCYTEITSGSGGDTASAYGS